MDEEGKINGIGEYISSRNEIVDEVEERQEKTRRLEYLGDGIFKE